MKTTNKLARKLGKLKRKQALINRQINAANVKLKRILSRQPPYQPPDYSRYFSSNKAW